jgi:hypothetical protein
MSEMRFNEPTISEPVQLLVESDNIEVEKKEEKKNPVHYDVKNIGLKVWKKIDKLNTLSILGLFVAAILIGSAANFYLKFRSSVIDTQSQTAALTESQTIIRDVSKLIILPKYEEPTIITISEVEKLSSRPFFADAKNGDKVLIYTKAHKAILYDPANKIIVNVALLDNGTSANVKNKNP